MPRSTDHILITGTYDSGFITIHSFSPTTRKFTHLHTITNSSPGPSWQLLTSDKRLLYSVTERIDDVHGGIDVYAVKNGGWDGLDHITRVPAVLEPVSLDVAEIDSGKGGYVLVSASYTGHGIDTYLIPPLSTSEENYTPTSTISPILGPIQTQSYLLPHGPGKRNPTRQDSSHPHQALVDPTQRFALIPDLGADLVRVYRFDPAAPGMLLQSGKDIATKEGLGPRHGVFYTSPEGRMFYFLLGELSNEVVVYEVEYTLTGEGEEEGKLPIVEFTQVQVLSVFPEGLEVPEGCTAAEIAVSHDGRFVYTSNRGDRSLSYPASPSGKSDTISIFSIGTIPSDLLTLVDFVPCGGLGPRHFVLTKDLLRAPSGEEFVTVANQGSGDVVVFRRDVETGKVAEEVARVGKEGGVGDGPTCVTWVL